MKNHLIAEELAKNFTARVFNEADTRHQILNRLLHEVLSWPHSSIIVDFLKAPQTTEGLTKYIWERVTAALNLDGLLERPLDELIKLFADRFEVAERQELAGYTKGTPEYLRDRNALILKWKQDEIYVAKRLKQHWGKVGKNAVISGRGRERPAGLLRPVAGFLVGRPGAPDFLGVVVVKFGEESLVCDLVAGGAGIAQSCVRDKA